MDERCSAKVWPNGAWHSYQCSKKAKVEVEGKSYCGLHDPIRKEAKYQAKMEIYKARWNRADLISKRDKIFRDIALIIINYPDDTIHLPNAAEINKLVDEYKDIVEQLDGKKEEE